MDYSNNLISVFPSGCTTPDMNYVIEFGFPSYPTYYTKTFFISENSQWNLSTSPIVEMSYIISVSSGLT